MRILGAASNAGHDAVPQGKGGTIMNQAPISRRAFVRTATIAGITVAAFGIAGCAPKAEGAEGAYRAGTYSASGQGKFGPVEVEVAFSDKAIEKVDVVKLEETKYICDRAVADVPARIVEHQSLGVDTVTGATLTSTAILAAVEDCVKQAGGNAGKLKGNYTPAPRSAETRELEADLVVVGAGAAGMVAAVGAAQRGANVVVLEKSCNVGGNGLVCGGYLEYAGSPADLRPDMTDMQIQELEEKLAAGDGSAVDPSYLAALKQEWADWQASGTKKVFDSKYLQPLEYTLPSGEGYEGSLRVCQREVDFGDWLIAEGFSFKEVVGIVGFPWPRWAVPAEGVCGQSYFELYNDMIDRNGYPVEVLLNTPATELVVEDGRVTGVVAQAEDGTVYRVRGTQGVALATGGFSGNPDMLRAYNKIWSWPENSAIPTTNAYGHHGDGITMGLAVGAAVGNMHLQMPFPFADCKNATDETTVGDDIDCVIVNKEGKRFMNEVLDRYTMTENIMAQTDQMMFMISDQDTSRVNGDVNRYGHNLQSLIDQGQLYRADTIEELGEQIGCGGAALKETVERYNEIARTGEDPDFGRTNFSELSPIENLPFYASPRTWAMHITSGGLVNDPADNYAVLREDGTPIEGLYAIGETAKGPAGVAVMSQGLALAQGLFPEA